MPFFRGFLVPAIESACLRKHAITRGRTYGGHVGIEHHERQAAIAFERVLVIKVENGLPFKRLDPLVARHVRIVLIHLAIALLPIEELAPCDTDPANEPVAWQFGLRRLIANEVDNRVTRIVGNPNAFQSSPRAFLARRTPARARRSPNPSSRSRTLHPAGSSGDEDESGAQRSEASERRKQHRTLREQNHQVTEIVFKDLAGTCAHQSNA